MSTHTCPGPGCSIQVPPAKLMCPGHWVQVPAPIRHEVYSAWDRGRGRGTQRHAQAVRAAIEAVTP